MPEIWVPTRTVVTAFRVPVAVTTDLKLPLVIGTVLNLGPLSLPLT